MENLTWHLRAIIKKCGKGKKHALNVERGAHGAADQGKSITATESARTKT